MQLQFSKENCTLTDLASASLATCLCSMPRLSFGKIEFVNAKDTLYSRLKSLAKSSKVNLYKRQ